MVNTTVKSIKNKNMKEVTVKEISKQITELINSNVSRLNSEDHRWKEHYEGIMSELDCEIEQLKAVIKDYKEENLTLNAIEQEGYLRGLITMVNRFRDAEFYV